MAAADPFAPQPFPTQLSLFTISLEELVEQSGVTEQDMEQWHRDGLLSFSPEESVRFEPFDVAEICFVAALVRSGLTREQIAELLHGLPKPYRYDPEMTAYNFFTRRWQQIPEPVETDFDHELEAFLDRAVRSGDVDALHEISRRVREALAEIRGRWAEASGRAS